MKSQHPQICRHQRHRYQHQQSPPQFDLGQSRRKNRQQAAYRQNIGDRRKRLVRPSVQLQKMTDHPIHRRKRNHS